jgi:hypothetical protein
MTPSLAEDAISFSFIVTLLIFFSVKNGSWIFEIRNSP